VLAWDQTPWLYLLNNQGQREAQVPVPVSLTAAACAEDASCFAAAGKGGELWLLAPDLSPRWQRQLPQAATAVALDPFGRYLAVADSQGGLSLLDRAGQGLWQNQLPRPLCHLAFVPEEPFLLGCADFGFVACLDMTGRIVWRDGLVVHCGALAVNGDGSRIVLACYSEGLRQYDLHGSRLPSLTPPAGCTLAASSFDGRRLLVAGPSSSLRLLDDRGEVLGQHALDRPAVAMALWPLADRAVVALANGPIAALETKKGSGVDSGSAGFAG
jgi:hypothetical protein